MCVCVSNILHVESKKYWTGKNESNWCYQGLGVEKWERSLRVHRICLPMQER